MSLKNKNFESLKLWLCEEYDNCEKYKGQFYESRLLNFAHEAEGQTKFIKNIFQNFFKEDFNTFYYKNKEITHEKK